MLFYEIVGQRESDLEMKGREETKQYRLAMLQTEFQTQDIKRGN